VPVRDAVRAVCEMLGSDPYFLACEGRVVAVVAPDQADAALAALAGLRFMRDPTRGGLATVMHEIVEVSGLGVVLREENVPVRDSVRSVCEMLGYDPYFLACEGRVVAVVAADDADRALAALRSAPGGGQAAIIGSVREQPIRVVLETTIGGERVIEELEDDPLPRIC
jgi:hydrogenase expression/formation protein HypE